MPGEALLCLRGVRKSFGAVRALSGVDLEVAPGEVHALVGENGAGKSTLMHILGGSFAADAGTMQYLGKSYAPSGPAQARAAGIALIHQELALAPHLSVEANITLGRESASFGTLRGQADKVREILAGLGHGDLDPRLPAGRLGVAERQIVEIARALYLDTRLLLMDEPTSALPGRDVDRLFQAMAALKASGVSILYISHFLDEVRRVSDRITVLRDGRTVSAGLHPGVPDAALLEAMAGRPPEETFPVRRQSPGEAVLTVEGLRVRSGTPPVSFILRRGQILGLAGLVGSGRSALLRSLFGLHRAAAGTLVTPRGRFAAGRLDPRRARAAGLEFLSEDRKEEGLALGLSVRANVTLPVLARFRRGLAPWLDLGREAEEARAACDGLRMRYGHLDQAVGSLSGGNQQKAALARLMLGGADVWLLDEPTRGVDVGSRSEIYRLVAEETGRGRAVIWAGSYLPELMGLCDTLAVLHRGTLSPMRPVAEWTETAAMAWAVFGEAGA